MDAYILIRHGEGDFLRGLADEARVKYAAYTSGPFTAFIKVVVPNPKALQSFRQAKLVGASAIAETLVLLTSGPRSPRIGKPNKNKPLEAIVLVNSERGRAPDVLQTASAIDGVIGSGIVAGRFDLVLVVQAKNINTMRKLLLDELQQVDGIVASQTCVIVGEVVPVPS